MAFFSILKSRSPRQTSRLLGMLFCLLATPVFGETLLDHVRADAGLCVRIDDLSGWSKDWQKSQLRQRLESMTLYQSWLKSQDVRNLQSTMRYIETMLGSPLPESILNLAGSEVVLAIYPQAIERPSGVLLSAPLDITQAQKLVALWNRLDEAQLSEQSGGYWKRTANKTDLYYLLHEGIFALSDREDLIREIASSSNREESIQTIPQWQRAQESLAGTDRAIVYFRPELWKGVVAKPSSSDPFETVLFQQLAVADSVSLGVTGPDGFRGRLSLLYKKNKEPTELIHYRKSYSTGASAWNAISANSLVLIAGRGGPEYLAKMLHDGLPDVKHRDWIFVREVLRGLLLGRDPLLDVLPRIGKNWQLELLDRPEANFPWATRFAFSLETADPPEEAANLRDALANLTETTLRILVNNLHLEAPGAIPKKIVEENETRISFCAPLGLIPTVQITNDEIVLASDRGLMEEDDVASNRVQVDGLPETILQEAQFGILIQTDRVLQSLLSNRDRLAPLLKTNSNDERERIWLNLTESIGLFDRLFLFGNARNGELRFDFGAAISPAVE